MGIIKTDIYGNIVRQKSFGIGLTIAVGSKILPLDDGSVVCIGYAVDTITKQKDIFVVKTDANTESLIQKIYKSNGNQSATDIVKTEEGFLILGTTDVEGEPGTNSTGNISGNKDILLLRIGNNLETISSEQYGYPGNDEGSALKPDLNQGYIIAGTTDRSEPIPRLDKNIFLLRINAQGSVTKQIIFGGTKDEYAADLEVLSDRIIVAGTSGTEGSNQSGYIWGFSSGISFTPLFDRQLDIEPGTPVKSSFTINAMCRYKTNSFVLAGQTGTGSSSRMVIFLTDTEGSFLEGRKKTTSGTGIHVAYDVITDEKDNIIVVGKNSYSNNSMISLMKFRF